MNTSIVFAQILGTVFVVGGLQALCNRKSMSAAIDEALHNYVSLWIIGLISLILGATIVALQNVWSYDWRVIITIIGWGGILKGAVIMIFPDFAKPVYRKCNTPAVLMSVGILVVILGAALLYLSFTA